MGPIKEQLSISLPHEITLLSRLYRSAVDQCAHRCDLSVASTLPLLLIGRNPGIRHGVLAEMVGIEAASLIRVIDRLAGDELVVRTEDQQDRRAKILCLTEAGKVQAGKIEFLLAGLRERVFGGLTVEDLEACNRVFSHIRLTLEQYISEQP
ncbi:MarR family winged helix-turn-helix transcriptional regulator [Iodobacter fluviatilis]|uniref:MarR family transcriptional regulator n=1 Tax=Iodobacter fluviatilis TaxID=537 RepID=A0A377Q8Z8_9NEIS|nr:MarR family transcriptional regulator [Iodobacter fluviatilis]TCU87000.1 MarR family transcriptional regulator [Iodobacter fluviatilis]STQ90331.1 Salmolysin [Iodobacter fluviatilis]